MEKRLGSGEILQRTLSQEQKMRTEINLIFPHQLFDDSPLLKNGMPFYLIEESLIFNQYKFHKQKLTFHRASMRSYRQKLQDLGHEVIYIQSNENLSDIRDFQTEIKKYKIQKIHLIDPVDDWLLQRLESLQGVSFSVYDSPAFLNTREDLRKFFKPNKKKYFHAQFYKQQRTERNILLENDKQPVGGQWSFDKENRKKYPKSKLPPRILYPSVSEEWQTAKDHVEKQFAGNYGTLCDETIFPINRQQALEWLEQFLFYRFFEFGLYEDAIVAEELILNHSVLSPLLNIGLLTPNEVLIKTLKFADENNVPINSVEGFVRQIIGWREFIRGMYVAKGRAMRCRNFGNFKNKMPKSFYQANTGITPVDKVIEKVLKTGYCHHIERLMVIGNFMLLCEIDPDDVYKWFSELFVDAFDWVMVPNVYGMSQFADGGLFATKPYLSGSNYIKKMSDFPAGPWEDIWNALFWRFLHVHKTFFLSNPRLSLLLRTLDRMNHETRNQHLQIADEFLKSLYDNDH